MPLKVVLRAGEKLVVNGAVLGAGERATTLFLHSHAQFLRGRDLLTEAEATCSLRRLYLAIQTFYLAVPHERPALAEVLRQAAAAAAAAHPEHDEAIEAACRQAEDGGCYQAMRAIAKLFRPA